jgi:membrane protein DedA with SNARE-associated domain
LYANISMVDWLAAVVDTHGYAIVGGLVMLESMGLPLPGESILLIAAAYAAYGRLSLIGVIAAAAAGAIVGDTIGYWIGRRGGRALLERVGRRAPWYRRRLARAEQFFDRHGGKTVFLGRFVAFLRMFAGPLAGVAGMRYGSFLAYNALGGICWAVLMGLVGYTFGSELPRLQQWAHRIGIAAVCALVIVLIVWRCRKAARMPS